LKELVLRRIGRTLAVLLLPHRLVHAVLEEVTGGLVGSKGNEFIDIMGIALEVAPSEGGFSFECSNSELELFGD
jgi:hypothetical protein